MAARVFLDTNVLVYAYDRSEPEKQRQAAELLDGVVAARAGAISAQVLAEFFVATTRKLVQPLAPDQAYERVQNFLRVWTVLDLSGMVVLEAVRGVREHQMSYWDAQIWATARLHQVPVVFSENFMDGRVVEAVRFVDPFAPGFRLEEWV